MMRTPLVVGLVFAICAACNSESSEVTNLKGDAQGTTFSISYRDASLRDLSGPVDSLLRVIDGSLSLWDDSSTVSRFNTANDRFESTDPHFGTLLALAESAYLGTEGAFDPTVLPLVDAWGTGRYGADALDTAAVTGLLRLVGLDRLSMEEVMVTGTNKVSNVIYYKADPQVRIDPNGIAQGYTVDKIAELLRIRGINDYMVELGGEVAAQGVNERGKPWAIQIDKPMEGGEHVRQTLVPLKDKSLATSGNYRKFVELGGVRYGHTIDPRTGRPAMHNLLSASVIANDCASADALGTALMVMGTEDAKRWLAGHSEFEAYLISDDGSGGYVVWTTPGWPSAEL